MNPLSRRRMMQAAGAAALVPQVSKGAPATNWPLREGPETPKLCLELGAGAMSVGAEEDRAVRLVKQIGITHLNGGGGRIPWDEETLKTRINRLKAHDLTLYILMIDVPATIRYGQKNRDEDIAKIVQSIKAAGRAGLPVIEYNFYSHRAMEGYHEEIGRAGSGYTAFDYSRMKGLPATPEEGTHSLDEMWANATYFLKAVIPEAEKAGVRMALHPNDPPAPESRGSGQIMGTLAGWKKLADIVKSPANGITFDCGVTREMGEDPVEVCRYFASRKQINHCHFRNVMVRKPYENYAEVWIDEGQVDMFGVMKELVRNKYSGTVYPEHPRAMDYDREHAGFKPFYPGGGGYAGFVYTVAYARAMLQAALASV